MKFWRLAILTAVMGAQAINAGDWPHWRGPSRNGVSAEKDWLSQWPDQGPPVTWKANVGLGFSSFVIGNGKALTAGHANETDTVYCFDAVSGKELWKHKYPAELGAKYYEGGTTGTPTIENGRAYWLSRWGDLFCFNLNDGKIIWNRQIQKETGVNVPDWGFTGALTIIGDALILNVGEAGMAVNKNTGKTIWQSANANCGYSTPLPYNDAVIVSNGEAYVAVNPADGKEIWRMKWLTQYGVNAADPIPVGDKIFISTGYGKGAALFKPSAGQEPTVIWKSKILRTQLNPGVLFDEHIYGVDGDTTEKATLKCIEVETGTEKWKHPNFGSGGILIADGKIIALNQVGELMVAPATPEGFKPISRAQILGGKSWTAPVLANGIVYCRNGRGDIAAVDLRKK